MENYVRRIRRFREKRQKKPNKFRDTRLKNQMFAQIMLEAYRLFGSNSPKKINQIARKKKHTNQFDLIGFD